MIKEIESLAEYNEVISGANAVVIGFWAPWAGPSVAIQATFQSLSDKYDILGFYKVNVDAQPDIASAASVTDLPVFQLYRSGGKNAMHVGANQAELQNFISRHALD